MAFFGPLFKPNFPVGPFHGTIWLIFQPKADSIVVWFLVHVPNVQMLEQHGVRKMRAEEGIQIS